MELYANNTRDDTRRLISTLAMGLVEQLDIKLKLEIKEALSVKYSGTSNNLYLCIADLL